MSVAQFTILLLCVYLVGIKCISYFAYRTSRSDSEDYFLAGRNVGMLALTGTIMASIFSTGTIVASPSEFFRQGAGYFWFFFFAPMPVIYFFLATKMWKLGKVKGYVTPGDMLGDFFQSHSVKFWAGAVGLLALLPYAVAQLVAIGKTFEALTDGNVTYFWGVTIASASIAAYLYFGGARAVVWTDMAQGFLLAFLLISAALLSVKWAGGWETMIDALMTHAPENATFAGKVSWTGYYEFGLLTLSFPFLPYIWQRMYMARSASAVAFSLCSYPVIFIILFFSAWVLGTSAFSLFPDGLQDADTVVGAIFRENAPYFGAMVLVAAFAAGMSTVDSQMLSAGSLFARDLTPLVFKRVNQRSSYLIGRWATMGLLGLLYLWSLTLQSQPVLDLIVFGMSLTVIFIPCVFGMFYWRQATSLGASWSMGLGLLVFLVKQFQLFGLDAYLPVMGPITWALMTAALAFVVVSLLTSSEKVAAKRREYDELLGLASKKDRLSGTIDSR